MYRILVFFSFIFVLFGLFEFQACKLSGDSLTNLTPNDCQSSVR